MDRRDGETIRARGVDRRAFLKAGGAAGLAVVAGGLEGILASGTPPAYAQPTELHLLHSISFIPEGDVELRRQIAEYNRQMKTAVRLETINLNDLQARITAAIQSRTGADVILMAHNWPHLYQNALADVSDLCEWKAKDQGGYFPQAEAAAREGKRWLALPYDIVGLLIAYRRSWFADVGVREPPRTLDEYRRIGAALKTKGRPIGQTLGHTLGDAPAWAYPLLWAFGGAETDPSGKKVALNSKGTIESVKWMVAFWREACDEGALAWDDTNNNRAFHANEISATLNGASIYIFAKRNPDKIKDDTGAPMWRDIAHFPIPDGPQPTPGYHIPISHAVLKYSQNPQLAKEFLRWLHAKEQFGKWFEIEEGFSVGATTFWEHHPIWGTVDDAMKAYRTAAQASRMFGYAGPSSGRATEVYSKFIIVDMYAKAVQGMAPAAAVKWAESELKKIYEA
ncbi:MAG: sugar ABC transporter substrate-binding protein [Candidatus Rokuibacteriota bacterium]|nr:MAG: sugar ABC transporter substrate-binding protein [Candidatus Rokubacteria bacterium]